MFRLIAPNSIIIQTEGLTEGAVCTTLLVRDFIDNNQALIDTNSNQFVEWNSGELIYSFIADGIDNGMVTFVSTHPKWYFARSMTTELLQK